MTKFIVETVSMTYRRYIVDAETTEDAGNVVIPHNKEPNSVSHLEETNEAVMGPYATLEEALEHIDDEANYD
ncbi:MAG TPA: hypothetical protein VGE45_01055 [Chloroflexia bacterium]|jgi:hypothetical protein